jgi:hypothetical protein
MQGIGHFPMIENYAHFRRYLLPELDIMAADEQSGRSGREPLEPRTGEDA